MSSIRELYGRFRHLIHEGGKFIVVGGIGTVVTFGVANALPQSHKYVAVTVATVVATVITYVGNRFWTFKHRQGQGTTRESAIFFILNGVGLLIYYACIWLIQDVAGLKGKLWYNAALVVGTGLGTLFRFWSYRKWVWLAPSATPVLSPNESDQERAQDLAAMVGAAPASHLQNGHLQNGHHQNGHHQNGQRAAIPGQRPRTPGAHRRTN